MSEDVVGHITLKNSKLIDDLMANPSLMEVQETTKVTNQLRLGLVRILTDAMQDVKADPQMLAQYRGIIKEIDQAVFMLARLSQEDKHLDNEEMVAKALNEVTKQLRFNPYQQRAEQAKEMGITEDAVSLPKLDDNEFQLVDGSDHIGLVETNYETFVNDVIPTIPKDEDEEELPLETDQEIVTRDEPLAPPTPGSL